MAGIWSKRLLCSVVQTVFEEIPKELVEAAELDGCGVWRMFVTIMLPLSKPIISVVAIFAITAAWSDFLLPYLVLNGTDKVTVMVKLFSFKDTPTDAVSVLRASFLPSYLRRSCLRYSRSRLRTVRQPVQ